MTDEQMPGKIKKGLENCMHLGGCAACPYFVNHIMVQCTPILAADALAYIEQLEAEKEQVETKLSMLLWHVTGGRFSKTSYTIEEMKSFADDYWQHVCDECEREEGANDENT